MAAACLLAGLLLVGCGRRSLPPEAVVRAWSDAVNTAENERAAKLFAGGAITVVGATERSLHTREEAIAWTAALPCAGLVRKLATHQDIVTVLFLLGDRERGSCAARNGTATIEFEVRHNKIVFYRQLASTPASG